MLDNGTVMNGKLIESPKSFQVACTVMTQIISSVASSQYGGQSVDIRHLGKYLRKSYNKYKNKLVEEFGDKIDDAILEQMAQDRLQDELRSGVQTIQYQINTLMTTNGQSPFVTLFLNLDPNDEYIEENAIIVEEILRQRLEGIKNEKGVYVTPAFPKLIYVLDEHNCLKGGKYDYITKLAGNVQPSASIQITSLRKRCVKTTKAMYSPVWDAVRSSLHGRMRTEIINGKDVSTRVLYP